MESSVDLSEIMQFEQNSPSKKIQRLFRLNSNYLAKPLGELGLGRGVMAFLLEVVFCNGIIQQDISRKLTIDRAATARALQQLEENGFITRVENEHNRREKCAYPTQKTSDMYDTIFPILEEHKEKMLSGFTTEERTTLLSMLDRMIANLQEP